MIVDVFPARRLGTLGSPALNTILPPQWPVTGDPRFNIEYINNWYQQAIPHLNAWANDFFAALRGMGFTIQMITTPETWYASPTSWAYEYNVIKDGFTYRANLQPVNAMQNSSDAFAQYIAQKWAQEKSIAQAAASQPSQTQSALPAQSTSSYVRSANIETPQGVKVGAPWTITVTGAPNQPVSVAAWQDGKSLGETTYGQTDANGRFTKTGTFGPETVGVWVETWKVGGTAVGTITFTVMPQALTTTTQNPSTTQTPSAPSGQSTSSYVRSANIQIPQGATVGAPWTITVTGAPNQPVSVAAWQDGKSLGETAYGRTDANGVFTKSGTFTPETVGVWVETWKVGGDPVGTITFTVMPAAGPADAPQTRATDHAIPPQTPVEVVSVGAPGSNAPGPNQTTSMPGAGPSAAEPWYKQIPIWAWALAGAGALFMMRDRR